MQQLREHQAGEDDEVAQVLDQRLEAARGQPPARLLIDDRPAHIHAGRLVRSGYGELTILRQYIAGR